MKAIRRIKIYLILALFLFAGCHSCAQDSSGILITLPSFRDYFPTLLERAQEWQADAYLTSADIPFYNGGIIIYAHFNSPSVDDESITIEVDRDDTYTIKSYSYPSPRIQLEPITLNNLMIDSQEALTLLQDEEGSHFISEADSICSKLQLERYFFTETHPAVWILYLSNCSDEPRRLYLDAVTGKVFDIPPIASPTRFFTLTP